MRTGMQLGWLLVPVSMAIACGSSEERAPNAPPDPIGSGGFSGHTSTTSGGESSGGAAGADTGSGGAGAQGGEAGSAGSGGTEPPLGALEVELESPVDAAVIIADGPEGVAQDLIDAHCVVRDPTGVGVQSVSIDVLNPDDGDRVVSTGSAPDRVDDEYVAQFAIANLVDLQKVELHHVTVRCRAIDRQQKVAQAAVDVFIDRGPLIEVPPQTSFQRVATPVQFEFRVKPSRLLPDGDPGAEIVDVTLEASGVPVKTLQQSGENWSALVDFSDRRLYPVTPNGEVRFNIQAVNQRQAKRTMTADVTLDGAGPSIRFVSPAPDTIIGKQQDIKFIVSDDKAGVDEDTLVFKIGTKAFPFDVNDPRWSRLADPGTYVFRIDSTDADDVISQTQVNVEVSDRAGNASANAAMPLYLDFQPPMVSLDPPNVRVVEYVGDLTSCSLSFDPVGPAAVNDRGRVLDHALFRVLAWDRTNGANGQSVFFYSGVDQVALFFQNDVSKPLLVDSDHDAKGTCDDVSSEALPLGLLSAIAPRGAYEWWDQATEAVEPTVVGRGCSVPLHPRPGSLCGNFSDMVYVPRFPAPAGAKEEPVIFGFDVKDGENDLLCTGNTLEVRSHFKKEGWVCMAARVTDQVGNRSVSAPLRVCYTQDPSKNPCEGIEPPNCTDGCSPDRSTPSYLVYRRSL